MAGVFLPHNNLSDIPPPFDVEADARIGVSKIRRKEGEVSLSTKSKFAIILVVKRIAPVFMRDGIYCTCTLTEFVECVTLNFEPLNF